ncbi:MAG: hypothetical protein U0167_10600 [bacterium]
MSRPCVRIASIAGLLGLFAAGCLTDSDKPSGAVAGTTDPATLVARHAAALSHRDYDAYAALLSDDFMFYPGSLAILDTSDLQDFPWLTGEGAFAWDRIGELGMIGQMFATPNTSIGAAFEVLSIRGTLDAGFDVDTHATFSVASRTFSAEADTRLVLRLSKARDGYLRIHSIREIPPELFYGGVTWAAIKMRYEP